MWGNRRLRACLASVGLLASSAVMVLLISVLDTVGEVFGRRDIATEQPMGDPTGRGTGVLKRASAAVITLVGSGSTGLANSPTVSVLVAKPSAPRQLQVEPV
jgi:hypothetical protein